MSARHVYVLLTPTRVRLYSKHSRALKVYQRAKRMGVQVEMTGDEVRSGDPYMRLKLETLDDWSTRTECSAYARAEASFGEGA